METESVLNVLRLIFSGLLILLSAVVSTSAQVDTVSLTGLIKDTNGGIAGARVSAVNRATTRCKRYRFFSR